MSGRYRRVTLDVPLNVYEAIQDIGRIKALPKRHLMNEALEFFIDNTETVFEAIDAKRAAVVEGLKNKIDEQENEDD